MSTLQSEASQGGPGCLALRAELGSKQLVKGQAEARPSPVCWDTDRPGLGAACCMFRGQLAAQGLGSLVDSWLL